jgi:hypothetical protein
MLGKILSLAIVLACVASAQAAVLTMTPTAPVPGSLDIANLVGCMTDANNVGTPADPPYANDATTYVAMDRGGQGQTFVTAGDKAGYRVKGIWMKHVSYTGTTDQTWYQMQAGGVLQVRITNPAAAGTDAFVMSKETYTITGTEQNALPSTTTNTQTGTGLWFHVTLADPVKLAPSTQYGFDLASLAGAAGTLFFETDGTSGNPYAAGSAYVTGASGVTTNTMEAAPGDHVFVVELELALPKVVWVSFHAGPNDAPSTAAAGVGFTVAPDKGYTDLLASNGYQVTRYLTTATPDVNMLNKADLIIISRSCNSGHYQSAAATIWNTQIKKPMILTSGYTLRKSRLGLVTASTTPPDITANINLTVANATHPIFAGIDLTDGTMKNAFAGVVAYPTDGTLALGISVSTDPANAEGQVLARVSAAGAPANGLMIAEWMAGATVIHDGGAGTDVLAGRRLVFLTGSRESGGKSSETAGMYDLTADGAKMFLNAVAYMAAPLPPQKIAIVNASFEDPNSKQQTWDGGTTAKGTFIDVPGWSSDIVAQDSGIEGPNAWPGTTDGVMAGYMMGTDPSVWQTLAYEITEKGDLVLSVDARDNWSAAAAMPAKLAMTLYCDISGIRLPLATKTVELTTTWTTFTLNLKGADASIGMGLPLGIELKNASKVTSTDNSWIGIDNVRLTVTR